jgi:hypothetical protein
MTGPRPLLDALPLDERDGRLRTLVLIAPMIEAGFLECDLLPALFGLPTGLPPDAARRHELTRRLALLDAATLLFDARHEPPARRPLALDVAGCSLIGGRPLSARLILTTQDHAVRLLVTSAHFTRPGFRLDQSSNILIEARPDDPDGAGLIHQALATLPADLGRWLPRHTHDALVATRRTLEAWSARPGRDTFHWASPSAPLVPTLIARWPDEEPIQRIRLVSPTWSLDGLATGLLDPLRQRGLLQAGAELKLVCAPHRNARGQTRPIVPAELAALDARRLGLHAAILTADPFAFYDPPRPSPDHPGRPLNARVLVLEGPHTTLAYTGSAAPTRDALGAGDSPAHAPLDAGVLLLRTGDARAALLSLIPRTTGAPLAPASVGEVTAHLAPPALTPAAPPPRGLRRAILRRAADGRALQLDLETSPDRLPPGWTLECPPAPTLHRADRRRPTPEHLSLQLSDRQTEAVLASGEVSLAQPEWPTETVAVDLAPELVPELAFGPPPPLDALVDVHRGRLSFGDALATTTPRAPRASQGDRVRDTLAALDALTDHLADAAATPAATRLALLGPTGPLALAARLSASARAGDTSPTAAAYLTVELIGAVRRALDRVTGDRRTAFAQAVRGAERQIGEHLAAIERHPHAPDAARLYRRLRAAATGQQ